MWDAELAENITSPADAMVRTVVFKSHVTGEICTGTIHLAAGDLNDVSDKSLRHALNAARYAKKDRETAPAEAR